jgi:hypothetical protein
VCSIFIASMTEGATFAAGKAANVHGAMLEFPT